MVHPAQVLRLKSTMRLTEPRRRELTPVRCWHSTLNRMPRPNLVVSE
jgi:hypothetical protein